MCFDKCLEHVYVKVAKPVLESYGFDCTRADELTLSGIIMEQVLEEIEKSDLILCDLTYENPNVFYELGMAHLLKKNTIMIKRFAIKFIGDCGDKSSFEKIKMIAINDDHIDVARDAFTSLYKIDPQKERPVLLNEGLRYQSNLYIRERVVTLLGNYPPDDKLFNQMRMQTGDSSWGVRRSVCEVFGRWGKKEAAGFLQEMLADSESQVRLAASEAIEQLYLAEQKKQEK
jgi:nucleoside 2-deoxyribosyltransferase